MGHLTTRTSCRDLCTLACGLVTLILYLSHTILRRYSNLLAWPHVLSNVQCRQISHVRICPIISPGRLLLALRYPKSVCPSGFLFLFLSLSNLIISFYDLYNINQWSLYLQSSYLMKNQPSSKATHNIQGLLV